jgi:hypothetical protein
MLKVVPLHFLNPPDRFSRPFGTTPVWLREPRTIVLGYIQVAPSGLAPLIEGG